MTFAGVLLSSLSLRGRITLFKSDRSNLFVCCGYMDEMGHLKASAA